MGASWAGAPEYPAPLHCNTLGGTSHVLTCNSQALMTSSCTTSPHS